MKFVITFIAFAVGFAVVILVKEEYGIWPVALILIPLVLGLAWFRISRGRWPWGDNGEPPSG